MNRLENKVAIITGGALGLGKACAELFAKEGAKVVVTDVKENEGKEVVQGINENGGDALFIKHDVSQEEGWNEVIKKTLDTYNKLDILVNNAGVGIGGSVEETSIDEWRWLMSINLDGVFIGTREAVKAMKDHGGSIINLSSIEGLVGDPNLAAYNTSKGGVRLLTKSAALHCAKSGYNVRVNSIHPGYIWTPMVENYLKEQGDVEAGRKALADLHPVGHVGEPNDIAYGALYLASDESKFVTGSELVIDGGYTAQ